MLIQWWSKLWLGHSSVAVSVCCLAAVCGIPHIISHINISSMLQLHQLNYICLSTLLNHPVHWTKCISQPLSVQQGNKLIPVTRRTKTSIQHLVPIQTTIYRARNPYQLYRRHINTWETCINQERKLLKCYCYWAISQTMPRACLRPLGVSSTKDLHSWIWIFEFCW